MTTLQMPKLGAVIEIRRTGAETGGELVEFDVIGRPRGFVAQPHVHTRQSERHEVIEGSMRLVLDGREHVLRAGRGDDRAGRRAAPPAPAGDGAGPRARPAAPRGRHRGVPAPARRAGPQPLRLPAAGRGRRVRARLRRQRPRRRAVAARPAHALEARSSASPRASTRSSTSGTSTRRARPCSARSPTPAATREWWKPVYIDVEADGEPALGKESRQHFKGRLPYHLHTRSRIVRLEPPHVIEGEVDGDLRGHGRWTLTDRAGGGTHVRFDWERVRRPPAAAAADAAAAPGAALEPRVGDRARGRGLGAVRAQPLGSADEDQATGAARGWHDRRRRAVEPAADPLRDRAGDRLLRRSCGYDVVFGPHHREVHGYLAGTDEQRAADLQWALTEPGIDMVHCCDGGYGAARLYPRIDWDALGDPRIVCGFSDITALHLALAKHGRWITFYGPTFTALHAQKDELTDETEEWFHRAFKPEPLGRVFEDPENPYVLTVGGGSAEAPIVGGCMTLVVRQPRHAVRDRDRRLHRHDRGPQRGPVHGRRAACTT